MIDGLSGRIPTEGWIEIKRLRRGRYGILDSNLQRGDHDLMLSASGWDDKVSLGKHNYDGHDCFGLGEHVVWEDVSLDFNDTEADDAPFGTIDAPNIRRIGDALENMANSAWNPWDV